MGRDYYLNKVRKLHKETVTKLEYGKKNKSRSKYFIFKAL